MRNIILILLLTSLSLVQISCKSNDKTSVLIIAVDELTFTDIACHQEEVPRSGFQILCNESVRFTHAYTTSTLSVPALGSLLTGLYPYQHKVRHNGAPALNPEIETAAEVALKRDYRTSFFSGGPPVFRKSGLQQGFELFDDNLIPSFTQLYRPFKKTSELFLTWLKHDVGSEAFFSILYAPDLIFTTTPTVTELGEVRNLSLESQIDALDESLFNLIENLKSTHRWDNTTVIFVGLNGHTTTSRHDEVSSLNLHGENTQVALFIKPSQSRKRDQAIQWKIDQNVSLVDVGRTVFEILGLSSVEGDSYFPTTSLLNALKTPNATWPEDRPILMESGWASWRQAGGLRSAAIANHVLMINDEKILLYNTLVDRFEINPLPLLQESILPFTKKLRGLLEPKDFPAFKGLDSEWTAKLSLPYSEWMRTDQEDLLLKDLKRLSSQHPQSMDLQNWTAQIALNQKSWETLKILGQRNKIEIWQYVAEKNLHLKPSSPQDVCFKLLTSPLLESQNLKACNDSLFLEMIDWVRAEIRGLNKEYQRKKFERSFKNYMLDQQVQRANIAAGMIWDTSAENIYSPSRTELILLLPEYAKLRSVIYKSISTEENLD